MLISTSSLLKSARVARNAVDDHTKWLSLEEYQFDADVRALGSARSWRHQARVPGAARDTAAIGPPPHATPGAAVAASVSTLRVSLCSKYMPRFDVAHIRTLIFHAPDDALNYVHSAAVSPLLVTSAAQAAPYNMCVYDGRTYVQWACHRACVAQTDDDMYDLLCLALAAITRAEPDGTGTDLHTRGLWPGETTDIAMTIRHARKNMTLHVPATVPVLPLPARDLVAWHAQHRAANHWQCRAACDTLLPALDAALQAQQRYQTALMPALEATLMVPPPSARAAPSTAAADAAAARDGAAAAATAVALGGLAIRALLQLVVAYVVVRPPSPLPSPDTAMSASASAAGAAGAGAVVPAAVAAATFR